MTPGSPFANLLPMSGGYIHGYSREERDRLVRQARTLADGVFGGLDFSGTSCLLEVGCAVGAELAILHEKWPHLDLTGVDLSEQHLEAASDLLRDGVRKGRVHLVHADAAGLPFGNETFDDVLTIWMLEHARNPAAVLAEAVRVLKPGGRLILTEVDNGTFRFEPPIPQAHTWWDRFNHFQLAGGGDPFIGPKLETMTRRAGSVPVSCETRHIISSSREPQRRSELIRYMRDLLLSGAQNLLEAGYVSGADAAELGQVFQGLENRTDLEVEYYAVRLVAEKPHRPGA